MYKKMLLLVALCMWCFTGCSKEEVKAEVPESTPVQQENAATDNAGTAEQEPAEEKIKVALLEKGSTYAYDILSKQERVWYDEISKALEGMSTNKRLDEQVMEKGLNEGNLDMIFQCVMYDHPELFYVDGYTITTQSSGGKTVAIDFTGNYTVNMKEAKARKQEIAKKVNEILAGAEGLKTDYDKVKYVYDTIILNTEYDLHSSDNQNIYSVFVNGKSVCQGYAKATQYLLNKLGVDCILVQGSVNGEAHVWNLVTIDGKTYHLDTTWGDVSYNMESAMGMDADELPQISYDYFCVTTDEIEGTHVINSLFKVPDCTATAANYFVHEDTQFKSYDKQKMRRFFANMQEDESRVVAVKAADYSCFNDIKADMIDNQGVFELIENKRASVYYAYNEDLLTLTFWVTND